MGKISKSTVLLFQTKSQAEDSMDLFIMAAPAVSISDSHVLRIQQLIQRPLNVNNSSVDLFNNLED